MGDDSDDSTQDSVGRVDFAGINALSSRPAGYAVALKCLQIQADAEDVDPSLRTDKRVKLHPDAWPWYQGALGEIEVGEILTGLGPEWFVRHSVPIGADTKDVDHLVIGPGGVFSINTKHHRGASVWVGDHVLRVNNANTPHLKVARSDALDVSGRLTKKVGFPVPVTPVIAVLNAGSIKDARSPQNRAVSVVGAHKLVSWLKAQPASLGSTKIYLLKLAAEEPETWHVDPRAADTFRIMQRFERLVGRVGAPHAGYPPVAPSASTHRPTRRPTRRPAAGRTTNGHPALPDIIRLWFATAIIITGLLIIRGVADQPCGSPTACLFPAVYMSLKPLLVLAGIAVIGRAVISTVRLLRPSNSRRRP
ncbi:nuclease-related domain-containing protein [Diaminobutyricibacter sp. McL0608]|uniref:nuclease-related domain-containing protein n=1 Tax=Leifsonia sp. McL0608 TaxID=3143537 RepID=UPI0031F3209E